MPYSNLESIFYYYNELNIDMYYIAVVMYPLLILYIWCCMFITSLGECPRVAAGAQYNSPDHINIFNIAKPSHIKANNTCLVEILKLNDIKTEE